MNFSTVSVKVVMNFVLVTTATMQQGRNPLDAKGHFITYEVSFRNPDLHRYHVTTYPMPSLFF